MGIRVDFSDTQVGDYSAVPPGWYLCTVTDAEVKEAGAKAKHPGSEYIKIELSVKEPSEYENKKFFVNASLLPNALFTLKTFLMAIGEEADGPMEFDIDDWSGKELAVRVNKYDYDGEEQNGVKRMAPANEYFEKSGNAEGALLP